jgi:hypothetical protein
MATAPVATTPTAHCAIVPGGPTDIFFQPNTPFALFITGEIDTAEKLDKYLQQFISDPLLKDSQNPFFANMRFKTTFTHLQMIVCMLDDTDGAIAKIVKVFGNTLMFINIKFCGAMTDKGLDQIDSECPLLQELTIDGAHQLTPARVMLLITNHPQMKKLHCDARQAALLKAFPASTKTFQELVGPPRCPGGHLHSDHAKTTPPAVPPPPTQAGALIQALGAPLERPAAKK